MLKEFQLSAVQGIALQHVFEKANEADAARRKVVDEIVGSLGVPPGSVLKMFDPRTGKLEIEVADGKEKAARKKGAGIAECKDPPPGGGPQSEPAPGGSSTPG